MSHDCFAFIEIDNLKLKNRLDVVSHARTHESTLYTVQCKIVMIKHVLRHQYWISLSFQPSPSSS